MDHPLIRHLQALAADDDRGALAALRRGLGKEPGTAIETYRYVVPFIQDEDQGPLRARPYFLVAALFGMHPRSARDESFGTTFRRLRDNPSRQARFRALLNAHAEDVDMHLRQAVSQLASDDVPVDWGTLFHHLRQWSHPDRWVQQRWARDFWTESTSSNPTKINP